MLIFVDRGPLHCLAVAPFEDSAVGCVVCPGTGADDAACLCGCHRDGVDILTFIRAHIALLQLQACSWHDPEELCGQDQPAEDIRAQAQFMLAVPATQDYGCACGSSKAIWDVCASLLAMTDHYGPDHEVTRRVASTWSQSPAFNPLWSV